MTKNTKQSLIIVSAPSGGGKTTLCRHLLDAFPDHIELSVSHTTRPPRANEQEGREYFFIDQNDFKKKIENEEFAEWAKVHNQFYGTLKENIESAFSRGKSVLLEIDVQGAEALRDAFPGKCFSIFISPPDMEVLESRLRARGTDSDESIETRIKNAKEEMSRRDEFDICLINDSLETTSEKLINTVKEFFDE